MKHRTLTRVALLGLCLAVLGGCAAGPADPAAEAERARQLAAEAGMPLELDGGKKWEVDDHTRGAAARLARLVRETPPPPSVDEARTLATALDTELRRLIDGCTMTGPAHDQLHVVLASLFPKLAELRDGEETGRLQAVHAELVSLFDAYEAHFES